MRHLPALSGRGRPSAWETPPGRGHPRAASSRDPSSWPYPQCTQPPVYSPYTVCGWTRKSAKVRKTSRCGHKMGQCWLLSQLLLRVARIGGQPVSSCGSAGDLSAPELYRSPWPPGTRAAEEAVISPPRAGAGCRPQPRLRPRLAPRPTGIPRLPATVPRWMLRVVTPPPTLVAQFWFRGSSDAPRCPRGPQEGRPDPMCLS